MHPGQTKIRRRIARAVITPAEDGSVTVVLSGELDHEGVAAVETDVHRAVALARGALAIDTSDVTFVDSAGLRLILQTQMTACSRSIDFLMAHPAENVVRLLKLTGLDDLLDVPR